MKVTAPLTIQYFIVMAATVQHYPSNGHYDHLSFSTSFVPSTYVVPSTHVVPSTYVVPNIMYPAPSILVIPSTDAHK